MNVQWCKKSNTTEESAAPAQLVNGVDRAELARIQVEASVSIVIPTYREVENIPLIIERIAKVRTGEPRTISK